MTTHHILQQRLGWLLGIEAHLTEVLPGVAEYFDDSPLRLSLQNHIGQFHRRQHQILATEKTSNLEIKITPCASIHKLIVDVVEVIETQPVSHVLHLMLANKLRLIKRYEADNYGEMSRYAQVLGYLRLSKLLEDAQQEEKSIETALTMLVTFGVANHSTNVYQTL